MENTPHSIKSLGIGSISRVSDGVRAEEGPHPLSQNHVPVVGQVPSKKEDEKDGIVARCVVGADGSFSRGAEVVLAEGVGGWEASERFVGREGGGGRGWEDEVVGRPTWDVLASVQRDEFSHTGGERGGGGRRL